jgi:hypothetical protein
MSDPTSIFNEQNPATQPNAAANAAPNAQGSDDLANLLGSIKNERGEAKYASVEAALVGLRNAQEYIPQLTAKLSTQEQELKTAREEAARVAELQRTIEALTSGNTGQPNTQASPTISKEDIAKLVTQTLTEQQQAVVAKSNVATVVNALQAKFGADAEKAYNTKAAEIGMTVAELNTLAARNPKAVFTLLGVTQEAPKQMSSSTQPSFNTDGFQPAKDSFIGRNAKPSLIGATTNDLNEESQRAKQMVEELHSQGKTISDLTNPKVYFKTFK